MVSNEATEQPRLEPMKWGGSEREEIRRRVANFKAHQQRFTREREDYAASTLMRVQGGVTAPQQDPNVRRKLTLLCVTHYMPWLSNTFLQALLSFVRFRCKHC
jgi:hypothetical protein